MPDQVYYTAVVVEDMFLYGCQGSTTAAAQHEMYIMRHNATRNDLYTCSRTQQSPPHVKEKILFLPAELLQRDSA